MDRKVASRLFASAMLVAIVVSAAATGDRGATLSVDQAKPVPGAGQPTPIVLAQGRCFNGRCY